MQTNLTKAKKSFKYKIFKFFILISLLPLLVISALSYYIVYHTQRNNISELQKRTMDNATDKVEKFISDKMEVLNLVINTDQSLNMDDMDEETRLLLESNNKVIFNIPKNLYQIHINTLNSLIDTVSLSGRDFKDLSFADISNGDVLVKRPALPNQEKQNISSQDVFKVASAGKNYFGPVLFGEKEPTMQLASQIMNSKNEIIGIVTAVIDLSEVKNEISKITLGNSGFVYITDNGGNLIAGSNNNFINNSENLATVPLIDRVIKNNVPAKLETYKNSLGDQVIFAGKKLNPDLGWYVFSEWPKSDAYAVLYNILKQTLVIITSAFILVIALSLIMAKQIVKPIDILAEGSKQIKQGNLSYAVNLKTDDEFELLGEEFNEMIKVLDENRKLKDEFVFIAAHELRTPVTAIKGYVSMILEGTFGKIEKTIEDNLKTVYNANERLVQLVQDLLEVARSESGKMNIAVKPLPLEENIVTVIKELTPLADNKGIKISYLPLEKNITVQADANKLKEVLINLIGNAIKYTLDNGSIAISHEIKSGEIITAIKDHGIGIDEESVQKLFSKFYRVKTDQTEKIEGTGLGLFICKEIVERMGGRIWAESKVGEGSTFYFSLKTA